MDFIECKGAKALTRFDSPVELRDLSHIIQFFQGASHPTLTRKIDE